MFQVSTLKRLLGVGKENLFFGSRIQKIQIYCFQCFLPIRKICSTFKKCFGHGQTFFKVNGVEIFKQIKKDGDCSPEFVLAGTQARRTFLDGFALLSLSKDLFWSARKNFAREGGSKNLHLWNFHNFWKFSLFKNSSLK